MRCLFLRLKYKGDIYLKGLTAFLVIITAVCLIDMISGAFVIIKTEEMCALISPICPPVFLLSLLMLLSRIILSYVIYTAFIRCMRCKNNFILALKACICILLSVLASCMFFRLRFCILPMILVALTIVLIVTMIFQSIGYKAVKRILIACMAVHIYFLIIILSSILI